MQYDENNLMEGKRRNKAALQKELGLPQSPDVPLLGFIGRMDYQKGVDFIQVRAAWLALLTTRGAVHAGKGELSWMP